MKFLKIAPVAAALLLASATTASAGARSLNELILNHDVCTNYSVSRIYCLSGVLDWARVSNYLCQNLDCSAWNTHKVRRLRAGFFIESSWSVEDCTANDWFTKGMYERREDGIYRKRFKTLSAFF